MVMNFYQQIFNFISPKKFLIPFSFSVLWSILNCWLIQEQINWETILSGFERAFFLTTCFIYFIPDNSTNIMTGGDGFCYITRIDNVGREMIHNQQYPLYNVNARIVDLDKSNLIRNPTVEDVANSQIIRFYSELTPNMLHFGDPWDLGNGTSRSFNIFWSARNGNFEQLLRFKKINNKWVYATKIIKNGKTLLEDIQREFPKNGIAW
jgi:hypothetical protein